jgi:hypothetical protein
MKKEKDMPAVIAQEQNPVGTVRPDKPIALSWGRVGRQVLAFLMAVAGIILLFEYFTKIVR